MKKIFKKWYFWLPVSLVALIGILLLTVMVINRSNTTLNPGDKNFAVNDTASITRVFLADKQNHSVLLERVSGNQWKLNGKYDAQPEMVQELLYTLMYVTVKNPVPKTQLDMAFKQLGSFATKVEVYATVYFIDFMGIKLFPYEKCIRTYFVGSATMDYTGTFMMMDGSDMPFVTHIPGFKGFLQPRYSPRETDWRDHKVFRYALNQIARVDVTYPQYTDRSFVLKNPDNIHFELLNDQGKSVKGLDTIRLINYLNAFVDVRFESFLQDLPAPKLDSIRRLSPFCIISVTDRNEKTNSISLMRIKLPEGSTNLNGDPIEYDPERLYGILNGKDLVMTQYFVFGPLMRYFSEFQPSNGGQPAEKEIFDSIL